MSNMSRNMRQRGRLGPSREHPRSRSYEATDQSVRRQRSRSPTDKDTTHRQRESLRSRNSSTEAPSHSLLRNQAATEMEQPQLSAKKSHPRNQHVKASSSPFQTKPITAQVQNSQGLATIPFAPRAMREEQEPTTSRMDHSPGYMQAMVNKHREPQCHNLSQPLVHQSRPQHIATPPKNMKPEDFVGIQGEHRLLPQKQKKTLPALGYHTLIGEEDWCLSCHVNGHRASNCPGLSDEGAVEEDQRYKLLWAIPPHHILLTACVEPKRARDLVKEVLVHGLDTRGHRQYVERRDLLFNQILDELSNRNLSSFQTVWFNFMSSINHGMKICARGLARRPLPVLEDAIKVQYTTKEKDLGVFVHDLFRHGSADDSPFIAKDLLQTVKESLEQTQSNYETWMKKWDAKLQEYLEECPKIGRLKSADRDWLMMAFSALRTAQPQFEYRFSIWVQHLTYPDIGALEEKLDLC